MRLTTRARLDTSFSGVLPVCSVSASCADAAAGAAALCGALALCNTEMSVSATRTRKQTAGVWKRAASGALGLGGAASGMSICIALVLLSSVSAFDLAADLLFVLALAFAFALVLVRDRASLPARCPRFRALSRSLLSRFSSADVTAAVTVVVIRPVSCPCAAPSSSPAAAAVVSFSWCSAFASFCLRFSISCSFRARKCASCSCVWMRVGLACVNNTGTSF